MSPALSKALNAPGVATTRPNRKSGSLGVSSIAEFLLSGICSLLLVRRVLRHEKANALPGRASAHGRPRCQGRRGEPFIGAQRRPLTEEADGAGACFASEEQLNFVKAFYRMEGLEVRNGTPCHEEWQRELTSLDERESLR